MKNININYLRKNNLIIFEYIAGSHAYGTALPESDKDIRGVFVQPLDDIMRNGFVDQVADEKNDVVFYELGRFMDLLVKNTPNVLEMLGVPEDCVIYRDPMFKIIESYKRYFITKKARWTFAEYAATQIRKARGYNKKMNWEENEMTRKTVLDFCYVLVGNGSVPFKRWAKNRGTQADYGLANIDHAHDVYNLHYLGEEKYGIVSNEETANDVQLTSIPKGMNPVGYLTFNKDAYSTHCKKYKEYQTWLKERNVNRFKMNKEHGKNYDSKNMAHTYRLLLMAHELAKGELRIRRTPEEIEKILKIRKGEYEYEDLLKEAEKMSDDLDQAFENSSIPEKVDKEFANELLYSLRYSFYKL